MGPRSFDRGEASCAWSAASASPLQWGRGRSTAERSPTSKSRHPGFSGFNGAAVVRPRREPADRRPAAAAHASMGPRSFDRGERDRDVREARPSGASMGPRSFDRGEQPGPPHQLAASACFNGAAVVRPRREIEATRDDMHELASMGPRSFDRGECNGVCCWSAALHASMGPRSFDRGEPERRPEMIETNWLQWGRGRSTAERRRRTEATSRSYCFNGAAVVRPRRVRAS